MNTDFRSTIWGRPSSSNGSEAGGASTTTGVVSHPGVTKDAPSSARVSGLDFTKAISGLMSHLDATPDHGFDREIRVKGASYDADIGVVRWSLSAEASTWSNPNNPAERYSQRILRFQGIKPESNLIDISVLDADAQAIEALISGNWESRVGKMITQFLAREVRNYTCTSIRLVKDLHSSEAGSSKALDLYKSRENKKAEHGLDLLDSCSTWVAGELYVFFDDLLLPSGNSYKPLGESDVRRKLEFTMSCLDSDIDEATLEALTAEKDLKEILEHSGEKPK